MSPGQYGTVTLRIAALVGFQVAVVLDELEETRALLLRSEGIGTCGQRKERDL